VAMKLLTKKLKRSAGGYVLPITRLERLW